MKKPLFALLFIISSIFSYAQVITPFSIRYQTTQKGGIRYLSNTSVSCSGVGCGAGRTEIAPAGTSTNNGFTAAYVDIDTDGTTFSSSSDSLALASCSQISFAGLYWGGEITNAAANYATRNQVKFKVGTGSYTNLTADVLQDNNTGYDSYHCFKDITSLVQAAGSNARFTVANVAARVGGTNRFGGWTIVVVYKNDLQPMRMLSVFNGLSNVSGANPITDITVNGFLSPLSGPVTFELGAVSFDGDRSSTGDQMHFNGGSGFVNISNAVNPLNDIFNSSLSYNGVAKASPFINPTYQNTLGYDADIFIPNNAALNYIGNSATSATLRLTTGGETYITQVVTMAIDVYEPDMRAAVRVEDLNGGSVVPGDTLQYTVAGKNIGSDPSVNTFITDTLEQNVSFVPGSIIISSGPNSGVKTDGAGDDQAEFISASRLVRVRIGTGANSITGGQVNNSAAGTDSTQFKFKVVVTSDCILLNCDAVIDNRAYIWGTGNVSGNAQNNQSTPGTIDGLGCAVPGTTSTSISHSCGAPQAFSNSPVCTAATIGLSATASSVASYSWTGPASFVSSLADPTISNATIARAGIYTVTITVPGTSCSYNANTSVAVSTSTNVLAGIAGAGSTLQTHSAGGYYNDASCNLISRLQSSGANPVTGSVTAKVWRETTVPTHGGSPYVARHYEITPATNAATATGTVTLYFLQSEFNAFNTSAGATQPKLPTGASDAAGIANLRIGKYPGTSANNSGLPTSYTGSSAVIDPVDASIVWNATYSRWEVSFNVVGFGGFIVQTNFYPLPVTWVSFNAEQVNEKILLKWQTATEANTSHFIIEHSTDGNSFSPLGTVAAAGNSNNLLSYDFIHQQPQPGENFYRLQQVDLDGRSHNSAVRKIVLGTISTGFVIRTNPVSNARLVVQFEKAGTAIICNSHGQVISRHRVDKGQQMINVNNLSQGIYLLRAGNEVRKFIVE
jgi:uncharacterized repeat protein (TIGR01451 family)